MPLAIPEPIVVPFGLNADPSLITDPIPVDSQIGIENGRASFNDGFPPLTATAKASGGIPPTIKDFNGLLFMITGQIAWMAAGMGGLFNTQVVDVLGGYQRGAVLQSVVDPAIYYMSKIDNNVDNPDGDVTNWWTFAPGSNPVSQQVESPAAGTVDNLFISGNCGALDIDTTAGNVVLTGITSNQNGQIVTITNTGPNLLTLAALTGSTVGNQFRLPTDLTLTTNDSITVRQLYEVGKWIRY